MKNSTQRFSAALLALWLAGPGTSGAAVTGDAAVTTGAPEAAIEQAILETNAEMIAAANRLDVDRFFEFIADDGRETIVQNGVVFRTRREAYEAVKRGLQGVAKLERRFKNPKVTIIDPNTALLVSDGSVDATFEDGRTMVATFAVSLVFVRQAGGWKVLHGHYSAPMNR